MRVEESEAPRAGHGETVVKVHASELNLLTIKPHPNEITAVIIRIF